MHFHANLALIGVMKLHNRLLEFSYFKNLEDDEQYSRKFNAEATRLVLAGSSGRQEQGRDGHGLD